MKTQTAFDLSKSFEKLLSETFFVYRGLRFEKTDAGFVHHGVLCRDHHEMDVLVEQSEHALYQSINRTK